MSFDRIISVLTAVNETDKNKIAELLMLCHIDLDKELDVACKNAGIKRDDLEFRIRMLINKLDKRFIYREELKNKITKKIKEGFIQQYKEELKDKINKIDSLFSLTYSKFYDKDAQIKGAEKMKEKILELLKEEIK